LWARLHLNKEKRDWKAMCHVLERDYMEELGVHGMIKGMDLQEFKSEDTGWIYPA
jgi:hypothetical protein